MSVIKVRDGNRVATTQLVALSIAESSPVDSGDNPDADIVLLKMKAAADARKAKEASVKKGLWQTLKEKLGVTKMEYAPRTVGQILAADRIQDELWKLRMALMESVYSIMEGAPMEDWAKLFAKNSEEMNAEMDRIIASLGSTGKAMELKALFTEFNAAAKALERGEASKGQDLADAMKRIEEFTFGVSPGAQTPPPQDEEEDMSGITKDGKPGASALTKALEGIKDEKVRALIVKAHEEELEALRAAKAQPATAPAATNAESDGAISPSVKALMAKMDSVLEDNKKLHAQVADLTKDKQANAFTNKARQLVADGLDMPVDKVANQLQKAYARSEEDGQELEDLFKGAAARSEFEDTMGSQLGSMGGADDLEGSGSVENEAQKKLDAMAKARAEKDGCSFHQAWARVAKENPKLKVEAIKAG